MLSSITTHSILVPPNIFNKSMPVHGVNH